MRLLSLTRSIPPHLYRFPHRRKRPVPSPSCSSRFRHHRPLHVSLLLLRLQASPQLSHRFLSRIQPAVHHPLRQPSLVHRRHRAASRTSFKRSRSLPRYRLQVGRALRRVASQISSSRSPPEHRSGRHRLSLRLIRSLHSRKQRPSHGMPKPPHPHLRRIRHLHRRLLLQETSPGSCNRLNTVQAQVSPPRISPHSHNRCRVIHPSSPRHTRVLQREERASTRVCCVAEAYASNPAVHLPPRPLPEVPSRLDWRLRLQNRRKRTKHPVRS